MRGSKLTLAEYNTARTLLDHGVEASYVATTIKRSLETISRIGRTKTYEEYRELVRELSVSKVSKEPELQATITNHDYEVEKYLKRIAESLELIASKKKEHTIMDYLWFAFLLAVTLFIGGLILQIGITLIGLMVGAIAMAIEWLYNLFKGGE